MVKPPKCKTCGKEEWQHVCWVDQPSIGRRYSEAELKKEMAASVRGVNKAGHATPAVASSATKSVATPAVARKVPRSVPQSKLTVAEAEIERLLAEVKQLKRLLAESNQSNKANAESNKPGFNKKAYQRELMRKRRAKFKAAKDGVRQFEG